MEALNAAAAVLPPISCLFDRRTEPRKNPSPFLPISPLKTSTSPRFVTNPPTLRECLSKGFHGGLVLLSSVVNAELARALTYEEALQQSVTSSDGVISFGVDNPAIVFGGVAVLALPLLLSQFLNKPNKPWGVDSARSAYEKLGVDATAQLLDIRPPGDVKAAGTPNLKGLGKKSVSLVYKGEDKPGFLKKLALKFKDPQNTTLFILDKFDGNSELVAELVTVNGFKAAYAVKDGAEGPRGWIKSGLPWIEPKKSFSLDFSSLTDSFGAIGDSVEGLSVALAVAAATGFGLLTFTEIETILQLLGSVALIQLVSKKLLLAEDRQATLKQVDEFLSNEVAPNELFDDVKAIGKAFLPPIVSKSLPAPAAAPVEASAPAPAPAPVEASAPAPAVAPVEASAPAPAEASAEPVSIDSTVQKAEVPAPELKLEAAPEVKSAPVAEVQAESNGGFPRPQSPFPYYPDLKPPSSPTPSQP